MCLQLACTRGRLNNRLSFDGPTPANPLITNSALAAGGEINTTVARWAAQAYFRYGGFAVRSAARRVEANVGALGYGNETYLGGATQLSGCHDGFCLYLSRILRPIWQQPVIQFTSLGSEPLAQPIDEALVREVQELLLNLKNFINTNPNLAMLVIVGKPGQTMEFQDAQNVSGIYHSFFYLLRVNLFHLQPFFLPSSAHLHLFLLFPPLLVTLSVNNNHGSSSTTFYSNVLRSQCFFVFFANLECSKCK
jgi:hypothetical protein